MSYNALSQRITHEFSTDAIPGWCSLPKALELVATVVALRPRVSLEVGVFGGKSLLPVAMACDAVDCGLVIGIDPWSTAASEEGYTGENAVWWSALDHEAILHGLVANIDRLGLGNRVIIQRTTSDEAPCPAVLDLLHIDGQHTAQAVKDVLKFAAAVRIGGVVCLDDLEWRNDGVAHVAQAVDALHQLGFVELYRSGSDGGTWGFFQRVTR
jgi:hypothetical protein